MRKVVKLKLTKREDHSKEMLREWDEKSKRVRDWLKANPNGGFVIVSYDRKPNGEFSSGTDFFVKDAMDLFILPHFASDKIRKCRDDSARPEFAEGTDNAG